MIDIFLKLVGFPAILLAVLLFRKKESNKANVVLSALVFTLGISCLIYSFNYLDFYLQFPHLIRIDWDIPLLCGHATLAASKMIFEKLDASELHLFNIQGIDLHITKENNKINMEFPVYNTVQEQAPVKLLEALGIFQVINSE